jgi:multiple sugar transport system ATP-binding protein
VAEIAEMLGLSDYLDRKPFQLSGGQRQRVAMGRAIIRSPSVYLMDEPLSNLDAQLRVQMRTEIGSLQARLGVATIYVTHDQSEAMTLGHRVAVLRDGVLQQCASPRELYDRPVNSFVATFIGSPAMNLMTVPIDEAGTARLADASVSLDAGAREALGSERTVVVGVRPESMELASHGIKATVEVVEELGPDAFVFSIAEFHGQTLKLVARVEARSRPVHGEQVWLSPHLDDAHLFHPSTGERLGTGGPGR